MLPTNKIINLHDFSKGIIQIIVAWNNQENDRFDPKYPNCLRAFFDFE